MKEKQSDKNICPKCQKTFHCSNSEKCWCFEYDIKPEILEKIKNEFDHCLCPECLKEFMDD